MEGMRVSADNPDGNSDTIDNTSIDSPDATNDTATIDGTDPAAPAIAESERTSTTRDLHRRRICDYMQDALAKPDAHQAALGALNADLMSVACHVGEALQEALEHEPATIAELEELDPTLNQLSKLGKLIGHLSQVGIKLAA